MSYNKVILVGAGGHSRVLLPLIKANGILPVGIYDDSFDASVQEQISGISVLGPLTAVSEDVQVIVAFGDLFKKKEALSRFDKQLSKVNWIHHTAVLAEGVNLGIRNQIMAGVYINTLVRMGDDNLVNTGAIVEHESTIGSNNHVSVGVVLCGRVQIGNNCFIGAGSIIIDKVKICDNVKIGANSTVISSITEQGTYVGTPLRKIK